jgi:hypothetical protein
MSTMRIFNVVASLLAVGFAAQAFAQEGGAARKFYYSSTPEGKTLPEGVARFRGIYQTATGDQAYDKNGNKSDSIVKATVVGSAAVFEYGLSDKLSLQFKMPFYMSQKVELNKTSAAYGTAKSGAYSSSFASLAKATSVSVTDQASLETSIKTAFIGACVTAGGSATTCATSYADGTLSSSGASAIGLASTFGAGSSSVSAKTYAAAAASASETSISKAIASAAESTGGRGMGDLEIGALYEAYVADPVFFSIGGGLRLPTGNRNLSGTEQDTTRSAYELGLRLNLDYLATDWFMISWQNQSEVGLAGTKREVNGVSQERKRDGVREIGFIHLKPSLAVASPSLDAVKTSFGISYDYDNAEKVTSAGKETVTDRAMVQNLYASVGYSFLGHGIPAQFDIDHEKPLKAQNQTVAVTKTTMTVKAFAKF